MHKCGRADALDCLLLLSTCCQMIVSCSGVWHYEIHLETQLTQNGSNHSKSIFSICCLLVINALLEKNGLSLLMSHRHVVVAMKSYGIFALHPSEILGNERGIYICRLKEALLHTEGRFWSDCWTKVSGWKLLCTGAWMECRCHDNLTAIICVTCKEYVS